MDFQEGSINGVDTVRTTAVEVHQGPNGVVEITNDHATQPAEGSNGPINGTVTEQQQIMQHPQLRLECERMAIQEGQRREQHKKNKGKEKVQDNQLNGGVPVAARRSARNNGQQPELSITDPVKLERKLKRQRGEECSGGDSHG